MSELEFLGSGVVNYFKLSKLCIFLVTILTLIYGIQSIIINASKFIKKGKFIKMNFKTISNFTAYFNKANSDDIIFQIDVICLLLTVIVTMIVTQVYQYNYLKNETMSNFQKYLPSDYTLMITNMPDVKFKKKDISSYFKKIWEEFHCKKSNPLIIRKIILTYDITKFVKILKNKDNLIQKLKKWKQYLDVKGHVPHTVDFSNIKNKIAKSNELIKRFQNEVQLEYSNKLSPFIFIVFDNPTSN